MTARDAYREAYKAAFENLHFNLGKPHKPLLNEVVRLMEGVPDSECVNKEVHMEVFVDPRGKL